MSVNKVKTKSGETKWEVRLHEDGRGSKRITRRFDKKIDADNFVHRFKEHNIQSEAFPFQNQTKIHLKTFQDEVNYWLSNASFKFSPGHLKRMEGILQEILPKYGNYTLDKINPEFLSEFQNEQKQRGLENTTINRKIQIFTTVLNHSAKHRRIPYNPTQGYTKLREEQSEMHFWSRSECESFLKFTQDKYQNNKDYWVYVVYLLAINTGLRAGEIWGLKPMDLSDDGLKLTIRRQFNRITKGFSITKGKKPRVVPCNLVLRNELFKLIENNNVKVDETIFMNSERNPINHDNFIKREFTQDVNEWHKITGCKKIRFHDLRHTAITLFINAGIDIKTVKEICGHSDITTTMNYVHMVAGNIEKVAQSFFISAAENKKEEVAS